MEVDGAGYGFSRGCVCVCVCLRVVSTEATKLRIC